MYSHTQGSQLFLFEDAYWYTEVEEGQERSDKCTYTEQPERPSVQREPAGADGEAFRNRKGLSYESEGRDPVFIVVRCIAANRTAGTVYEPINQSINDYWQLSAFVLGRNDPENSRPRIEQLPGINGFWESLSWD